MPVVTTHPPASNIETSFIDRQLHFNARLYCQRDWRSISSALSRNPSHRSLLILFKDILNPFKSDHFQSNSHVARSITLPVILSWTPQHGTHFNKPRKSAGPDAQNVYLCHFCVKLCSDPIEHNGDLFQVLHTPKIFTVLVSKLYPA